MEDRYDSLEREAKSIQDENESLMIALKLLNNEINMNISMSKICMMRKPLGWQEVITRQCPETKRESVNYQLEERFYWHRASQTINNERTTVIVGDCIIKNVQAIKLAKTVGQRVVIKPFPGATIRDVRLHVVPTINKSPHQICLHVGTNDLRSSTPSDVADAIIDLASERGWECFRVWNSYIWTNCKEWWLPRRRQSGKQTSKTILQPK